MITVATFDDIVRLGDGLAESGTGAGGVTFLVTFVVVRLFHPFLPSAPLVLYPTPLISPCKLPPFQLSKWLLPQTCIFFLHLSQNHGVVPNRGKDTESIVDSNCMSSFSRHGAWLMSAS